MSAELPISHHRSELSPAAFHQQLRRLESLETLMHQGATVVAEVARFMIEVRESLCRVEQERALLSEQQESSSREHTGLTEKVAELQKSTETSALRIAEQEIIIHQLRASAVDPATFVPRVDLENLKTSSEQKLSALSARVAELEAALKNEREAGQVALKQARESAAEFHLHEMSLVKSRLTALEHQLDLERERRVRLMEVVKTNEVKIIPRPQPEPVS